MKRLFVVILLILNLLIACSQAPESGIDTAGFDHAVRAQDDFFQYINGTWLEKTEIPADKSNYGAFTALHDRAQADLKQIIEESAQQAGKEKGSDEQKVGDFYLSYMDSILIGNLGIKPLEEDLKRIDLVTNRKDLVSLFAHMIQINVQIPFTFYINQDLKQSDRYIGYIHQSGLGMPDRDYYFREDEKFSDIRKKYAVYLSDLLKLAGIDQAAKKAEKIIAMETALAKGHWTRTENRDRDKTYNKYTIAQIGELTPAFPWSDYIQQAEIENAGELIVRQPTYLTHFNRVFSDYSIDEWKDYLTAKLLSGSATLLGNDFVDLHFGFYGKTLSGTEKNQPRWKRAVEAIDKVLGEVVGKVYVKKHFKPEAKTRMIQLVENLRSAYAGRIEQLDWMGADTKKEALNKLSKFKAKIGYPDKWKDYTTLEIKKEDLIGNFKRSNLVEYRREINKLGQPIDRTEWFMTPQTVNAYYNPPMNEVVFPAAILQPPFFNMDADDAVNYGAIGAVIGHELTHGFDDQGRKSDGEGNLRDWWTEQDGSQFKARADKMVAQYNQYVPLDTMHLNGRLTLGENIADLGGLTIAYYAYKKSLNGTEGPVIDGMSGDQRFFAGWAQVWRRKYRDAELRNRILTDPHSPSKYRVLGIVCNMPEFYSAFNLTENDKLFLGENQRIKIW